MARQVVAYVSPWCPNCIDAREALKGWGVECTFIDIKRDYEAAKKVRTWTGFESVPTLVIAEEGGVEPYEAPADLARGASPRGVDRGVMLTEPTRAQLQAWLTKHGILQGEPSRGTA
jgi:glutaredoxin